MCLGALLVACAPDPYTGHGPPPTPPLPTAVAGVSAVAVQARDNVFVEPHVTVEVGTEVVWSNVGRNDHDVVPVEFEDDPTAAPWGVTPEAFRPGDVYSHVFDAPGVYAYVCTIHGIGDKGMAGTVTVTE